MSKSFFKEFTSPPAGYGIVPFYWWLGDPLTKERLSCQLNQLENHHISGLQINYAHSDEGGQGWGLTYEGTPPLFSEEWWELFSWFVSEANRRGIKVSLSDYTLFAPGQGYFTDMVLRRHPEMRGQLLRCHRQNIQAGESVTVSLPAPPLCVVLMTENNTENLNWDFDGETLAAIPEWDGELIVVYAETVPYSYDPMHPQAGEEIIDVFFGEFERRLGPVGMHGLDFFFSDELEFGISGNLWNSFFADEFMARKGYDICRYLYLIFCEGADSVKIRLDYYDVIVTLEEENYFSKVYSWHEERGMTYGCDHGGRGYNVVEFGDYMCTQKYNQGPGCDQPNLQSDIVKNKVAASISHLHRRPRVWLEGFYGSGWGTSTEQLTDAVARNYVMGQNLLSLHGLYYSTHGGWWEWAPPCNCIHMPYWSHMEMFLGAVERLSYMMTRGVHSCDVAILYPVDAVDGGPDGERSVSVAFELAKMLYSHGIDFDFLDRESALAADISDGRLNISGESYSFIIIPQMQTLRLSVFKKLLAAAEAGVHIVNIGELPGYSDGDITDIRRKLSHLCICIPDMESSFDHILSNSRRDVIPERTEQFYINHRVSGNSEIYMTYGIPLGERCFFRGHGRVVWMNVRNGKKYLLDDADETEDGIIIRMPVESAEIQLFVICNDVQYDEVFQKREDVETVTLDDEWDFELVPTMDNTYGDFELPATDGVLPCLIKELNTVEDGRRVRVTYGAFFLSKEAFDSEDGYQDAIRAAVDGDTDGFVPYEFSMRYGVLNGPGHQGYHGLKGNVTDEFLTIGKMVQTLTSEEFVSYEHGFGKVFCTNVLCSSPVTAQILTGPIPPDVLYINGVCTNRNYVTLKQGQNRVVAGFRECGRTHLIFAVGEVKDAVLPLSMKWFHHKNILPFACNGADTPQTFSFTAPPALQTLRIPCEGNVTAVAIGEENAIITEHDGVFTASVGTVSTHPCTVTITVANTCGHLGGAVFSAPIQAICTKGRIRTGDWSCIDGLKFYSGGAIYSQTVHLQENMISKPAVLSVDRIVSTAEAFVNGHSLGIRFAPPWSWNIGGELHAGENKIQFEVYNTIGNHYEYIPTRYKSGIESGIIGQVRLEFGKI